MLTHVGVDESVDNLDGCRGIWLTRQHTAVEIQRCPDARGHSKADSASSASWGKPSGSAEVIDLTRQHNVCSAGLTRILSARLPRRR